MKAKEIRDLTTLETEEQVRFSKEELLNLRFQLIIDQLEEATRIRIVRKTIARLKTVARGREIKRSKAN